MQNESAAGNAVPLRDTHADENGSVSVSSPGIDPRDVEQMLLSHEYVLDAEVASVREEGRGELLKAVVTLKKGHAPSNELKTELAWFVGVEFGPTTRFKDIEFRVNRPGSVRRQVRVVDTSEEESEEDEIIWISDHRVNVTEVVRALRGHEDVAKAKVIRVPDEREGEMLKAFVTLNEGVAPSNDLKSELAWHALSVAGCMISFMDIEFSELQSENGRPQAVETTEPAIETERDMMEPHMMEEGDIIHISGHRVDTSEVARALLGHEGVARVKVVGVPDKRKGEMLKAFVTLKEGVYPSSDLKTELAWYARLEVGPMVSFSDIEFRVSGPGPDRSVPDRPRVAGTREEGDLVHIYGHRMNTARVESALEGHEDVAHAIVIGVPDRKKGEILKAFVTLREGCVPSGELKRELAWYARLKAGHMVLFKDIEFGNYLTGGEDVDTVRELLKEKEMKLSIDDDKAGNTGDAGEAGNAGGTSPGQAGKAPDGMVIVDEVNAEESALRIISHRISSTEVTAALLSHPSVSDAAVVSVPDDRKGEVLKAFVRLKKGVVPSNDLKLELAWHVMTELKPMVLFKSIDLEAPRSPQSTGAAQARIDDEAVSISGHTILSSEVETVLMKHDAVSYAIVLGVPDEKHGEALQAFVTLEKGVLPSNELKEELAWHARTEIGPQVVFKSIWFRDYIPKNATVNALRSILKAGALNIPARLSITIAD